MAFSGLIDNLQERWRPVQAKLFPQLVLLELTDAKVSGQSLQGKDPQPLSIEAPLPELTLRDGMPLEKEPIGDLIGDLLVNENLIDACVLAALPPSAVEWRVVVWPFQEMPDEPLAALRQLDPPLRLSTPLEASYIDLQPLPGQPAQMLLGAAPRSLVDGWIEVFSLAGVQLERLAPSQSCQLVALEPILRRAPEGQLIALLDPLQGHCRLVLFRSGIPVFERQLPSEEGKLVPELLRCLSFYRRKDKGAKELRLLLAQPLLAQKQLEDVLGLKAEIVETEPFASLVLQGLAATESNR